MERSFNPIILSGVKKVLFTPWQDDDTLDLSGDRYDLENLVGDTVQITQDDNDTEEIPCETRDEPLYEVITLGKYQVSMESGDINPELLDVCLNFKKNAGGTIAFAPSTYRKKYAHVEVVMDQMSFIVPRILISPNLAIETLKTGIARGIIAGSAYSVDVSTGSGTKRATPFFAIKAGTTAPTIAALGHGAGTYEDDTTGALHVNPANVNFVKAGGSKIVYVTGNTSNPTLTPSESWLTATYDNGAIVVTASNNTSSSARTGTVTVTSGGLTETISATQAGS